MGTTPSKPTAKGTRPTASEKEDQGATLHDAPTATDKREDINREKEIGTLHTALAASKKLVVELRTKETKLKHQLDDQKSEYECRLQQSKAVGVLALIVAVLACIGAVAFAYKAQGSTTVASTQPYYPTLDADQPTEPVDLELADCKPGTTWNAGQCINIGTNDVGGQPRRDSRAEDYSTTGPVVLIHRDAFLSIAWRDHQLEKHVAAQLWKDMTMAPQVDLLSALQVISHMLMPNYSMGFAAICLGLLLAIIALVLLLVWHWKSMTWKQQLLTSSLYFGGFLVTGWLSWRAYLPSAALSRSSEAMLTPSGYLLVCAVVVSPLMTMSTVIGCAKSYLKASKKASASRSGETTLADVLDVTWFRLAIEITPSLVSFGIFALLGVPFGPLIFPGLLSLTIFVLDMVSTLQLNMKSPRRAVFRLICGSVLVLGLALIGIAHVVRTVGWEAMKGAPADPNATPYVVYGGDVSVWIRMLANGYVSTALFLLFMASSWKGEGRYSDDAFNVPISGDKGTDVTLYAAAHVLLLVYAVNAGDMLTTTASLFGLLCWALACPFACIPLGRAKAGGRGSATPQIVQRDVWALTYVGSNMLLFVVGFYLKEPLQDLVGIAEGLAGVVLGPLGLAVFSLWILLSTETQVPKITVLILNLLEIAVAVELKKQLMMVLGLLGSSVYVIYIGNVFFKGAVSFIITLSVLAAAVILVGFVANGE